jgi:hypothetical protein
MELLMHFRLSLVCIAILSFYLIPSPSFAQEERHWSFSLIRAAQVRGGLGNTLTDHWPAYITFLRAAKEFAGSKDGLGWEVEGQVVKHFGLQHHWEFNGLVVARWHPFPWDRYLDTSFAIGEGLSYATEVPPVEVARGQDTAKLLNYLLFELTMALPAYPNMQVVALMHHRSGAFGLFSGVTGGSNFFGAGLKYLFR